MTVASPSGVRKKLLRLILLPLGVCTAALAHEALVEGFQAPPPAAKPRVWWHWMGGNVTEDGVKLDFEWMNRIGIGGVQQFDAAIDVGMPVDTPRIVANPLVYRSSEWQQAMRYSVEAAHKCGLEFAVAASAGWSVTGGPWVEPRQAMKKLVWSEAFVGGGARFEGRLARPPEISGPFQNISFAGIGTPEPGKTPVYYADVATIAYRATPTEYPRVQLAARVTTSAGAIDCARLCDGDLAQPVLLPFGSDPHAWIQFAFAQPQRIHAVTIVISRPLAWDPLRESGPIAWLEASYDGETFTKVVDLPRQGALQQTAAFPPVVAQYFRVVLNRRELTFRERMGFSPAPLGHGIAELVLHPTARMNRFEDKAGYSTRQLTPEDDMCEVGGEDIVRLADIIDLSSRTRADGTLDWEPPAGRWVVLRFGYSLTGRLNGPAPREGRGLEVDKLNRSHVKSYIDGYLAGFENALGAKLTGLQYLLTDSFEQGPQNWTDDMLAQFRERRGYDMLPWLPVLAGRVVERADESDRFLWDFRKTLGELIADAHYGQIAASLEERGLGLYSESHEHGRAFIGDGMEVKKLANIPMGAIWTAMPGQNSAAFRDADIRESASVAHLYGKNLVAAEAFTAASLDRPYGFTPGMLKPIADRAMAAGLNRFVIHTSVHQPDLRLGPGLGLGINGQWFTRKETWAELAGSWVSYLARSSYLLQQGRFVADIAYLYGEDTNITSQFHADTPAIPAGYNFDYVNPDALIHELVVEGGRVVTRHGMSYRLLALDASTQRMSLPLLRKLRSLIHAGAVVVGAKPVRTPSLADDESEFRALVEELWGDVPGERTVGRGRVISDRSLSAALDSMQILPDVVFTAWPGADLRFVHRALDEGDVYFVSNSTAQAGTVEASFRVSGRRPELWRADTGTITPLAYRMEDGRTIVPLKLDSHDAVFVVFRARAEKRVAVTPDPTTEVLAVVDGSWDVSFPPYLGAPATTRFERLHSWTESPDAGVKYFSGTATYAKTVQVPKSWLQEGYRLELDLGSVNDLAEVIINGRMVSVLWKAPFKVDLTEAIKTGDNRLEIKVTNLWPNRLIGDKQPGAHPIAFAAFDPYKADSPLLPSGLLGPVSFKKVGGAR